MPLEKYERKNSVRFGISFYKYAEYDKSYLPAALDKTPTLTNTKFVTMLAVAVLMPKIFNCGIISVLNSFTEPCWKNFIKIKKLTYRCV